MLKRINTKTFHRHLYAGWMSPYITLLKRDNDQREGTVASITLYQCRRKREHRSGEPIQRSMTVHNQTVWQIPRVELDRVGVHFISTLDRIIDYDSYEEQKPRYWQPEADTDITIQLGENYINVSCKRVDPPS